MVGFASAATNEASVPGARILVIVARFNPEITTLLKDGAMQALTNAQAQATVIDVPGALEIGPAAAIALDAAERTGSPYEGVVALGCVIRGETYHFEIVANESARTLSDLAVRRSLPVGNGVLTVETHAQALLRADPQQGDKGGDAAAAALTLIGLARSLRTSA